SQIARDTHQVARELCQPQAATLAGRCSNGAVLRSFPLPCPAPRRHFGDQYQPRCKPSRAAGHDSANNALGLRVTRESNAVAVQTQPALIKVRHTTPAKALRRGCESAPKPSQCTSSRLPARETGLSVCYSTAIGAGDASPATRLPALLEPVQRHN